jgi:hypothetical protein
MVTVSHVTQSANPEVCDGFPTEPSYDEHQEATAASTERPWDATQHQVCIVWRSQPITTGIASANIRDGARNPQE